MPPAAASSVDVSHDGADLGDGVSRAHGGIEVAPCVAMTNMSGYRAAVRDFRRHLIESTLHTLGGNRAQTARVLGRQRTYLLRLIRELSVGAPASGPLSTRRPR